MKRQILILDYGSGNVKSVLNICKYIEDNTIISNDVENIKKCSHIILPGVGSFKSSMDRIKKKLPLEEIMNQIINKQKPILGICVGMQVLSNIGYEFGECSGLGLIDGLVKKLETDKYPLPNVGWNNIVVEKDCVLFKKIEKDNSFYFVHSFAFIAKNEANIIASSLYEKKFTCAIQKKNIFGVQFHPEKSQKSGIQLLKNFINI
jgi:imidazole glycerol-phosphate synthase subunit HisH